MTTDQLGSGPVSGFCRFSLFGACEGERRQPAHEPELFDEERWSENAPAS